jgi:hypothetical protein
LDHQLLINLLCPSILSLPNLWQPKIEPPSFGLLLTYKWWSIATCIRRSIHNWRTRWGMLFLNMGGTITYVLSQFHLRRFTIARRICISYFLDLCAVNVCVHLCYGETGCNT